MRVVHAADIHLDSPLRGLTRLADDDVARQVRQASRRAVRNLVRLTVDEGAEALVLAGDIYDGDWPDYATGRFFAQELGVLHEHGIPVFMAAGNHDAESEISRALTLPPNVTVLSTDAPETVVDDDRGLAVHGQGFPTRAVTENLVLAYPKRVPGLVNIGVLHTAVTGAEGHATYAPCSPEDLTRTEYDYFALGHVHEHRVVTSGHRVAAFSGNIQGRHPRETGPKGALVVDVEPDEQARLRHVPLDVARWAAVEVDATGATGIDDVLGVLDERLLDARAAAGDRLLVARVTVVGTTRLAAELADSERLQEEVSLVAGRRGITVERARSRATVPDAHDSADPELSRAVAEAGRALAGDPFRLRELAAPLDREFRTALRSDLRDPDVLGRLAADAVAGLTARLAPRED